MNPIRQRLESFLDRGGLIQIPTPEQKPLILDLLEAFVRLMDERGVSADGLMRELAEDTQEGGNNGRS